MRDRAVLSLLAIVSFMAVFAVLIIVVEVTSLPQ
jgi:hypothetical protein